MAPIHLYSDPKKSESKGECNEHRNIALMNHALAVLKNNT